MFGWEILATLCGLTHVWLLTRERAIAWPFGLVSVGVYVWIFFQSRLYSDAILHVGYVALNLYGWVHWLHPHPGRSELPVTRLRKGQILLMAFVIALGTLSWGRVMDVRTDADYAYIDAFTTVASFLAQFLLTRKVIDNWIVWILVDLVAIPLYLVKGLTVTAGLYALYLALCVKGWKEWQTHLKAAVA